MVIVLPGKEAHTNSLPDRRVRIRNDQKQLLAALDFWSQHFTNMSKDPNAALWNPNFDSEKVEADFVAALLNVGWSLQEAKARVQLDRNQISRSSAGPLVNPHGNAILIKICDAVEEAMQRMGMNSHQTIASGIEPIVGVFATKTNVIMTDESVVTVSAFLFRFCGLVARAFTRTLRLDPWYWSSPSYIEHGGLNLVRKEGGARLVYWFQIFTSYAVTGTQVMVPFIPANREELVLFEQIAHAMEVFILAHEYGHHHFDHGRNLDDDPKAEEFAADQFALNVCAEVGHDNLGLPSPYLRSGAGAIITLMALDLLRDVEALATGIPRNLSPTHPSTHARIEKILRTRGSDPAEFAALQDFRITSQRIMTVVGKELRPVLLKMKPRLQSQRQLIWSGEQAAEQV